MKLFPAVVLLLAGLLRADAAGRGAEMPWTTYEAEQMKTTGQRLGPDYAPNRPEAEASQQQCVKLAGGQAVEFSALAAANALVVRYSLPDATNGGGLVSTLELFQNEKLVRTIPVTSRLSWLYGWYPFTNSPAAGTPRNFFDEVRVKDLSVAKGDVLRLQKKSDAVEFCLLDFADLEQVAAPLAPPGKSLSVTDPRFGAAADGRTDDTVALRKCIEAASKEGCAVWLPPGDYKVTGDLNLPKDTVIQGAGMWHSALVGDDAAYAEWQKRVRLTGWGGNIHLADFAIFGKLNFRKDSEPNDGIGGWFGNDSTVKRIWIEHTKAGVWVNNSSNLVVEGCRFRNTVADGLNFCVGMLNSTATNCTTRGAGDDGFAIWPATHAPQDFKPGGNLVTHCSAQFPFLANGAAIYGGEGNQIKDCLFTDVLSGCGVLISTTFPTASAERGVNNHFSGLTVVRNCELVRCGGFDPWRTWRAALQLCLDGRDISGVQIQNVSILDSISDGLSVVGPEKGTNCLANATFENLRIPNAGLGVSGRHALWINRSVSGDVLLRNSEITNRENQSSNFIIRVGKTDTAGRPESPAGVAFGRE